jgi:hypothetical protein
MAFEDTLIFKELGLEEKIWKVTLTDGSIKKSKAWLLTHEDSQYKEVTPHVPKPTEKMSYVRKRSKTIITSK